MNEYPSQDNQPPQEPQQFNQPPPQQYPQQQYPSQPGIPLYPQYPYQQPPVLPTLDPPQAQLAKMPSGLSFKERFKWNMEQDKIKNMGVPFFRQKSGCMPTWLVLVLVLFFGCAMCSGIVNGIASAGNGVGSNTATSAQTTPTIDATATQDAQNQQATVNAVPQVQTLKPQTLFLPL